MPKHLPAGFTYSNQVRLTKGGLAYFEMLEGLINQAKNTIYFQIYIFDEDDTGRRIAHALIAAAKRNVAVHLLLDGYASKGLSTSFVQEMKDAGVHFRWFTLYVKNRKFYLGRRLHHKVIVIDSNESLVCGLNISDRYNDMPENIAWLDWAAYVVGEASIELEQVCKRRIKDNSSHAFHKKSGLIQIDENSKLGCAIKINQNDWVARKSEITKSYLQMLRGASSKIVIMSPYFLPGRAFRKQLRQATQRGVKVQLILAGMSDISLSKYGERYLYDWLMRYNIQIYEYQKSVLHGKIATCDGHWTTVGSYNVNNLSAYASIELNLEIKNDAFAKNVEETLESIIEKECVQITKKVYKAEINFVKRILQGAAYNILRFMLVLFTFRKKQQE
jgi:cardiolipin synthase A/B